MNDIILKEGRVFCTPQQEKDNLILKRNAILDTTFKKYLPPYKRMISAIDKRIDELEEEILKSEGFEPIGEQEQYRNLARNMDFMMKL